MNTLNNQSPTTPATRPRVGLIIVGDEIMSGKRSDKHMPKMIELLAERGLQLDYADYVGDSPELITSTLKRAFSSGDIIFACGGIGATPDDHTRQCAAKALGLPLVLHPKAEDLIRQRMKDLALETGQPYEPEHPNNIHRLNMGMFPQGANIITNPYNKIPGFTYGTVHFVPGFPVMAWPVIASVLDDCYSHLFQTAAWIEKSVIVMGSMEAVLTPLMESLEKDFPGIKVFSLPSVDHPQYGRHIELGVKGAPNSAEKAYIAMLEGLSRFNLKLGPELVRN